jgi:hypothetical protein
MAAGVVKALEVGREPVPSLPVDSLKKKSAPTADSLIIRPQVALTTIQKRRSRL